MIIFRWNGTDLTQFGTVATGGSISVSGGEIILQSNSGNHNKDTLGFWPSQVILGNRPGMSLEYDWKVSSLSDGDGFLPSDIIQITNNTSESGSPTPFPDVRVGLGAWRDNSTFPLNFGTIRDSTHSPVGSPVYSSLNLSADTYYHLKHSIASNGQHSLSVGSDINFITTLGPTTSGGNYAGIAYAGDATKNGDFNNTTNPLTVTNAQSNYTISRPFSDTGWQLNKYYSLTDAGGAHVEAILVTAINGNDVTFARGQLGTTATAFPNGRGIYSIPELRFYAQHHSGGLSARYKNWIITDDGSYTPPAPATLSATTGGAGAVNLSWDDASVSSTNSDSIRIERSTQSGSGFSEIANLPVGTESYADSGLTPSTTYYYRIRSRVTYNSQTENSSYSSESSALSGASSGGGGEDPPPVRPRGGGIGGIVGTRGGPFSRG